MLAPRCPFEVSRVTRESQTRAELISVEKIHNILRPLGVGVRPDWGGHQGTLRVTVVLSPVWACTQTHAVVKKEASGTLAIYAVYCMQVLPKANKQILKSGIISMVKCLGGKLLMSSAHFVKHQTVRWTRGKREASVTRETRMRQRQQNVDCRN